jgi:hypothetical protein
MAMNNPNEFEMFRTATRNWYRADEVDKRIVILTAHWIAQYTRQDARIKVLEDALALEGVVLDE